MIVILDSGILGLLVSPIQNTSESEENEIFQCTQWFYNLLAKGFPVVTSEISDYEVRRELVRINSQGLQNLDNLRQEKVNLSFLLVNTKVLQRAAKFWAEARQNHITTAEDKNIDADMIITAQWSILSEENPGRAVFIATKNLRHLRIFAKDYAQEWRNI